MMIRGPHPKPPHGPHGPHGHVHGEPHRPHEFVHRGRREFTPGEAAFEFEMEVEGPGEQFHMRRQMSGEDLRLAILLMAEESPRHGYDIIKALEERTAGAYRPSPGVIYPALTYLEEAGFVDGSSEGNRKSYAITEAGREHLDQNREHAEAVLDGLAKIGERVGRLRERFEEQGRRGGKSPEGNAPDRDIPGVIPEVNEARRRLKAAIAGAVGGPEDEQFRLAKILNKAADKIAGPEIDI